VRVMPVFKGDVKRTVVEEIEEIRREIEEMRSRIDRIRETMFSSLEESVQPLYTHYEDEKGYHYLIDVPYANESDVRLTVGEGEILVLITNKQKQRYSLRIRTPRAADTSRISIKRIKWLIHVDIPKG